MLEPFMESDPYVIVRFSVTGNQLNTNHGFSLYSAICEYLPDLHNSEWGKSMAIELISGTPLGGGKFS